jgi:C2 domain
MVVGADDLERVVKHSEQQPYYVLECGHQRSRSKPSSTGEGVHPVWNTAHRFVLTDEMKINAVIKDDVTKALIGQGVIELARCERIRSHGAAPAAWLAPVRIVGAICTPPLTCTLLSLHLPSHHLQCVSVRA